MELLSAYIPMDRRQAMVRNEDLPDRTSGAALFADISGFTPLTEALLNEFGPRRGPEEVTRHLNNVYGELIAEVHRYGGSVIGFSGDAITCWFDGDDGLRATACALDMQQVMGQLAEVETPSGMVVSLGIKVAVVAGPARRFRVGAPQIRYIDVLAGATLDRMAAAEKLAERSEVVVGPEVIARLGDAVRIVERRSKTETDERFAVVAGRTVPVETTPWPALPTDALTDEQTRPWLLPPVYERLKAGRGQFLAELRPAVALFLNFGGLNYDEDDAAGEKLDAYIRWVQKVLKRYKGNLVQLTFGDKGSYLYAPFGVPLAHDDDASHAVGAALELKSPPKEMSYIENVRIGVSQGHVWTGACGSSTRRTYGVMGDEVNVAARLMAACQPGQILVSQRVMNAAQRHFKFHQFPGFVVKGKALPIYVAAPVAPLPPTRQMAPLEPPVGRADELARLDELLNEVTAGAGRVVRIVGLVGIGKSRLVAELNRQAMTRVWRTLVGNCQSIGQGVSYLPWREIFQDFLGLPSSWPPAQQVMHMKMMLQGINQDWLERLPLLGDLLGLDIADTPTTAAFDARFRQQSLFDLVGGLLTRWAKQQPLLVIIEDVHWIDEASAALLEALGRGLETAQVLLVITQRPYEGNHIAKGNHIGIAPTLNALAHYRQLDLTELTPGAVRDLVTRRLGGELPPDILDFIQERAQGNPFFAEELADALRDTSRLQQVEKRWVLASDSAVSQLPDTIQKVVLARIDCLNEARRLTLKVSSVIGRMFEVDLEERMHPARLARETLDAQLRGLEQRDFIHLELPEPRLTYLFKHNVTQEVAYGMLPFARRLQLHQAVGEALEELTPDDVERLAYHYSRSDARGKTAKYLGAAADKARRGYVNETALDYYERALALKTRPEWLRGKIEVLHLLGRREEEAETLQVLADTPGASAAEVDYLWARYHEVVGDYEAAKDAGERSKQAYQSAGDCDGEAHCLALLGLAARKQGDYLQARARYEEALTLLDETTQPTEMALALNGLGMVYMNLGDYAEARECHERARELQQTHEDRLGEANSLNYLGLISYDLGDFTNLLVYHRQASALRQAIGDRWGEGGSLFNLGLGNHVLGNYVQAEDYYQQALVVQRAIGDRWGEANALNSYGVLCQDLGDLTKARSLLEQALELSRSIGDHHGEAATLLNLGAISRDLGDFARAEGFLENTLALARKLSHRLLESYALSYMGLLHLATGAAQPARDCAMAALAIRRDLRQRPLQADDLALLAMAFMELGERDVALRYAREALAILTEYKGEGPDAPQCDYFYCYWVLVATGHPEEARRALQAAHDLVMARAAKIADPALRRSFLENVAQNREIVAEYVRREA